MPEDAIEAVAHALYQAQECARGWEREPDLLKAKFRKTARAAIETLDAHRQPSFTGDIPPLIITQDIVSAREALLYSPDVSALSLPGQQTCRVVLHGPDMKIGAANEAFFKAAGRGGFLGLPAHEAFPELKDQGYLQLLDQVFQTRKSFLGLMMPILFQSRRGAPLEEHITDFVYRPIVNEAGQATGLFIESHDRTEWARA
ncbi:PAS domain-containing protein [Microvirga guangxiensis]|uniref:PAS domain-containing protein n=1 Tax=Microvirga guangxiensis TaxID=549386 RepID=UPI001587148A|nr:PAS domain-containing protein [Microvirga guangxiensis]